MSIKTVYFQERFNINITHKMFEIHENNFYDDIFNAKP